MLPQKTVFAEDGQVSNALDHGSNDFEELGKDLTNDPEMEKLYKPLEECKPRLNGRSLNAMRLKQIRERALSQKTYTDL